MGNENGTRPDTPEAASVPLSTSRWRSRYLLALFALVLLALLFALLGAFAWLEFHLRAARAAAARGHHPRAIEHLRSCRSLRPYDPDVLLLCASVARRSGAWAEAEDLLDRYWKQRGDDDALVLERLLLRATRGELQQTMPLLQARIEQQDPAAPLAREAILIGLLHRHRLDEAEKQLEQWLKDEPDSTLAFMQKGKLREVQAHTTDALEVYARLLELDPEHDEARLRLSTLLLQVHDSQQALPHLEYLRDRVPTNVEAQVLLAQALDAQNRTSEARDLLEKILHAHPDQAAALAESGRIALREGQAETACDLLERSVAIDPGQLSTRYQLFLALSRTGKKAEATKQQQAIQQMEADIKEIKTLLEERLQYAPNDPEVPFQIAMIALRAGRPREYLRWLHNALEVDPDHLPAHRALAGYHREAGNPILAARHRAIAQRLRVAQPAANVPQRKQP